MSKSLDDYVCGCPAPRHLSKFARFIWAHETFDYGWHLEELVKLQKALECWDEYRLARKHGPSVWMEKKAQEFERLWIWGAVSYGYEKVESILNYPDSLEEFLIAMGEPDMCDFYGVKD